MTVEGLDLRRGMSDDDDDESSYTTVTSLNDPSGWRSLTVGGRNLRRERPEYILVFQKHPVFLFMNGANNQSLLGKVHLNNKENKVLFLGLLRTHLKEQMLSKQK